MPLKAAASIFFALFFTALYNQERLKIGTIYLVNQEIIQKKSAVYDQEQFHIKHGL